MKNLQMPDRSLDYKKQSKQISKWLWRSVETAWSKWIVVWVSGWIDSAVVSTLAAMSWKALTVLELPIHQKWDEVSRAKEHIEWLQNNFSNVSSQIVDLSNIYDSMVELQSPWDNLESEELANVNLRSRLRAVQLYSTANRKNSIVVWTGNRVEDMWIWFFTKYWDWAVDFSPIWEYYKTEVYKLWEYIWVNNNIVTAAPTDWLWEDGSTDEDQIGASYPELEWAMVKYDSFKMSLAENYQQITQETINQFVNSFSWRMKEVMKIFVTRHLQNAHKMQMPPVFKIEE